MFESLDTQELVNLATKLISANSAVCAEYGVNSPLNSELCDLYTSLESLLGAHNITF